MVLFVWVKLATTFDSSVSHYRFTYAIQEIEILVLLVWIRGWLPYSIVVSAIIDLLIVLRRT